MLTFLVSIAGFFLILAAMWQISPAWTIAALIGGPIWLVLTALSFERWGRKRDEFRAAMRERAEREQNAP